MNTYRTVGCCQFQKGIETASKGGWYKVVVVTAKLVRFLHSISERTRFDTQHDTMLLQIYLCF